MEITVAMLREGAYSVEVAVCMLGFFETLSEKDRRRYAAVEARKLGFGGIEYMAEMFGCSTRTILRGLDELDQLPDDPAQGRVRRVGGGRKKRSMSNRNSS